MSSAEDILDRARARRQAMRDPSKHAGGAPEGFVLKGVSTYDPKAKQWIKTTRDNNVEALLDAFTIAIEEKGVTHARPIAEPQHTQSTDLLTVYPMGDPHLGMLAWHGETGEDFDLSIATTNLFEATDRLVGLAPASERALIINLGDFFHSDNSSGVTARSGHSLDLDTRWAKILRAGVDVLIRCIDRALQKHRTVDVWCKIGNHDDHSAVMLALCLSHHYRDEPRVNVVTDPRMFHYYEFGQCLIGSTHGHTVKAKDLPGLMAVDQKQAWGRTSFRHWYTGHVHHESVKEYSGASVETMRTLAASDAWHHGQGYRSGRSMVCDIWHRDRGRIQRHEVGVGSLGGAA